MTDNVSPIIAANQAAVVDHLMALFGRAMEGKVEITAIKAVPEKVAPRTQFFRLDQIDEAAQYAIEINREPQWNVYVGAALRRESVFPGSAADDTDFLRTYAVWADADNGVQVAKAKAAYDAAGLQPTLVVVTGRAPERRAQFWWTLETPITDIDVVRATVRGLADGLETDHAVCTGKQLMRLAGTLAWPKPNKLGRVLELTELIKPATALRELTLEQVHRAFAPSTRHSQTGQIADVEIAHTGALGLDEKIMDGREGYAFRLVRATLREYVGENGVEPTADDIYQAVAPTYFKKVDQVRPGRGADFLKAKCLEAVRAFHAGQIPGMATLDEAVITWADRKRGDGRPFDGEEAEDDPPPTTDAKPAVIQATPYRWIEPSKIPPRDVLYGKHFFRKFLGVTVAPGGLGKSSNAIGEIVAMVTGQNLLGEAPKGELRAWYWNGEDPHEELQRRIQAACLHYNVTEADLGDRLFVDSGRDVEIIIAQEDRGGLKIATPVTDALIATIRDRRIDVLVVDPFVASHAVAENDNTKIEAVVRQWMRVAEEGGCAVELIHHVRKPGGNAQETTVDDARGAGALLAKARSARVLNAMSTSEADEAGIDRKDRFRFFRIDNGKANLTPRGGETRWRQMVGVPLRNRIATQEDEIGVVTEWQRPSAFVGMKEHHLPAVRAAVEAGDWRLDVQCSNWVGVAVAGALGVDPTDAREKARIKTMIATWIKNDVLRVVNQLDQARRVRPFVIVGKDPE
jgi:hypothetical protein